MFVGAGASGLAVIDATYPRTVLPLAAYEEETPHHLGGSGRYTMSSWITWDGFWSTYRYDIWDLVAPQNPQSRVEGYGGGMFEEPSLHVLDVEGDLFSFSSGTVGHPATPVICDLGEEPPYCHGFDAYYDAPAQLAGSVAWLHTDTSELVAIDITDLHNPAVLSSVGAPSGALRVELGGAYIVNGISLRDDLAVSTHANGFQVISAADASAPETVSPVVGVPDAHSTTAWVGDLLYISRYFGGLEVWDPSNLPTPTLLGVAAGPDHDVYCGEGCLTVPGATYPLDCANVVAVEEEPRGGAVPDVVRMLRAVPNPFNPRTGVHFELQQESRVELAVHDLRGRRVRTLAIGAWAAGDHEVECDGRDDAGRGLASGVYLARLMAGATENAVKVLLAR